MPRVTIYRADGAPVQRAVGFAGGFFPPDAAACDLIASTPAPRDEEEPIEICREGAD